MARSKINITSLSNTTHRLADESKCLNLTAWLTSISRLRSQLKRGTARKILLDVLSFLLHCSKHPFKARCKSAINVVLEFMDDPESIVRSAVAEVGRSLLSPVPALLTLPRLSSTTTERITSHDGPICSQPRANTC